MGIARSSMAEPSPPPASLSQPEVRTVTAAEITKLVREELDRNNKYLEFAQNQIEKDRGFYKYVYGFAASFIAVMVALAGFFQYTSTSQMRTEMRVSLDAELERDKAEITSLGVQAQATVAQELANVRTEVQKRIDTEFQSENIAARIRDAARSITEKQLETIIRAETSSQVAKGIKNQQPFIQKTVEDQTKEAVKALEPTISSSVEKGDGRSSKQVGRSDSGSNEGLCRLYSHGEPSNIGTE